jgi:parallel beta-helix repeat protein
MEHRVTLKNSSKTLTLTYAPGVTSGNITVAAGTWEITVEAYYDDILLGTGTTYSEPEVPLGTVTVTAGLTVTATVKMTQSAEAVFLVGSKDEWDDAISSGAGSDCGKYIYITNDFPFTPAPASSDPSGGIYGNITILGGNHTITLKFDGTSQGSFLTIGSGDVTMQDLKVKVASAAGSTNTAPLVEINGGTFTMKSGELSGNTNDDSNGGGGVYVTNGTFTMTGGTISGNTADGNGGGVYVDTNGTFTMTGGTISGNSATVIATSSGGGVYVASNGIFNMTGGTISGNSAFSGGGGVYVGTNGTFSKTGGTIYGSNGEANSNTVTKTVTSGGHAVYVANPAKYRDTTAGPTVNLSTADLTTNWDK